MNVDFKRGIFLGVKVVIDKTGESFHSIDNYGIAIANTDYIGTPEQETSYIDVPFRDGLIDASEAISGRIIYKKRPINIVFKGIKEINQWDSIISDIRNRIDGKICKLIFDNDMGYYWIGRVSITDFSRHLEAGLFTLSISNADPYKYNITDSTEDWLWDEFDFNTGIITTIPMITVNSESNPYIITIPSGQKETVPEFYCYNAENLRINFNYGIGDYHIMENGINRFPQLFVGGETDVDLHFLGKGDVQIIYRERRL